MNQKLTDKCFLFFYCMASLFLIRGDSFYIPFCFLAVGCSSLYSAFPDLPLSWLFPGCFTLLGLFFPEAVLFLPLISRDFEKQPFSYGLWSITALELLISPKTPDQRLLIFLGCILSLLLKHRYTAFLDLSIRYRKTRDDDTERKILLEERNRSLLEKQNSELYAATLRERNRIAREIHDNVGHLLTRSILMVGALRTLQKDDSLAEPFAQLNDTLDQAMDTIRISVHDLRDSSMDLKEVLNTLVQEFTYCPVSLQYDLPDRLSSELKYSLTAIAKEGLVNIARHSNATRASITALEHPAFYQFILQDNGTMSTASPDNLSSGMGLSNIRSRVKALGGTLKLSQDPGFCIYITIPKQKQGGIFS